MYILSCQATDMFRYLMENCVLFDRMVICLFQGYYLIINCKKVRWKDKNNNKIETSLLEAPIHACAKIGKPNNIGI